MMSAVFDQVRAIDLHQRQNRERLARMVVQLFDHWQLSAPDQASLLGLSPASRATVARYRNGEPLADNTDLLARAAAAESADRIPSEAPLITRAFDYGTLVSFPFVNVNGQGTRFSDGLDYGAWYGSLALETTV